MSAIAGVLSSEHHELVNTMLDKLSHRGTSGRKVWQGPNAALGSIAIQEIDETPGPYQTPSGGRSIVWDGRLTERTGPRQELQFHTLEEETDAEIALHYYEERGSRAIGRLAGEFSLAIVDGERILLARDRLGIRPLYYGFTDGTLCFASEIKALVGIGDEAHEFPPGHFLLSDRGLYPYHPYLPETTQLVDALESARRLTDYLQNAVQKSLPPRALKQGYG